MIKPIFVLGGKHCGTTLTATILGANSRCFLIPMESGAYSIEHIRQLRRPFIKQVSKIDSDFVVEKTPDHVYQIDKIQKDWPDSAIFVVTRNPIDQVASMFKRNKNFNKSVYDCSNDLSACIYAINKENTFLVQYEDIVKNFNKTVSQMCNFAKINFESSMINFYDHSPTWYQNQLHDEHHRIRSEQMKTPLFDDSGKGKSILNQSQIDQVVFDCMDKYETLKQQ